MQGQQADRRQIIKRPGRQKFCPDFYESQMLVEAIMSLSTSETESVT